MIAYPWLVDGLMTRLLEAGKGDKAILFLHGLSTRADRWNRNLDFFASQGYRAIAVDLPGHGFAARPADYPYGVPAFADFVAALLDSLSLESVDLVGTSLGGHVAARFACAHPGRVRTLALVDSVGVVPITRETGEGVRNAVRNTSHAGIAAKLNNAFETKSVLTEDLILEDWRINNTPGAERVFEVLGAYFAERLNDDVVGPALAGLADRLPMLLVWGAEDRIVPLAVGEASHLALPRARYEVIPGTGHAPYLEAPERFNPLLAGFIAGSAPDTTKKA